MSPAYHPFRFFSALTLLLSFLLLAVCLNPGQAYQEPSKKSAKKEEEEEPPKKPKQTGKKPLKKEEEEEPPKNAKQAGKKPFKEEEEEPSKPKRRVPLRVGDEDVEEKQPKPAAQPRPKPGAEVNELEREAKTARNPVAAELFQSLARPHDIAVMPSGTRLRIVPVPQYIGTKPAFSGELTLKGYTDEWRTGREFKVTRNLLNAVDPYENIALNKVNEFLKSGLEKEPEAANKNQYRLELFQDAEKVLVAVLRFHESAVERGLRTAEGWEALEKKLRSRLQEVQLEQLRALTSARDWNGAFDLATRLVEKYRRVDEVQIEVARLLADHAQQAIQAQDYGEVRRRLLLVEEMFPNKAQTESVRQELRKKAETIVVEARKLEANGNTKEAVSILQTAESIYPQLPGLHDYYLRLSQKYPVIYVSVRNLPENLSPATAFSDAEKQAVELMFESLVKLAYTPALGQRYASELAGDLPELVPLGRRFRLTRNALWANGKPVTAADIRHTVRLLSDPQFPGRTPEWADLLQGGVSVDQGDDRYVSLTLRQGYLDPLSLMEFKVLPQTLTGRADDADFAKAPVGSGPYRFDKDKTQPGDLVFSANPYYESRPGKTGLPRIREIHFVRSQTPKGDFLSGKLHLSLDLSARQYRELESVPDVTLYHPRNWRIYFLAVNHRRPALKNLALRRAIAHAINREQILNEKFREGYATFHRPLNGPYPPGSWAAKPGIDPDPYKPELAKAQAEKAKTERALQGKLTLKIPEGDPVLAEACDLIRAQVAAAGITLELVPRSLSDLHRDVEQINDYDLAYYWHDYPTEAYWLWPLFDPQAAYPGGRNFLGYVNDDVLASLFRKTMSHRDPTVVQELTHRIHELLYEQMPLIPLWQLDSLYAIHGSVQPPGRLDPLLIFTDVDRWVLEKK
jgi:peptide/nickel transport system substrate-binding protein